MRNCYGAGNDGDAVMFDMIAEGDEIYGMLVLIAALLTLFVAVKMRR